MKNIRVGGVPEHFNYPWHYAIANGIFQKLGLSIEWSDVKGGSGAMCSMLENDEIDVALVLTEGITKHIHKGGTARIIQQYVKSPLLWGVHARVTGNFHQEDLSTSRIARSRPGSGSHLMAYVHAEEQNYSITEKNFITVKNIDGAASAFQEGEADILLWEKFMTQPYVDRGEMSRIGQCASPWPCFMMVGSRDFITTDEETIHLLSKGILKACQEVSETKDTVRKIAEMYHLEESQVAKWYSTIEWQTSPWISIKMLRNVTETLDRIDILEANPLEARKLCYAGAKLY